MKLYRITSEKYASRLEASGRANRWNMEKQYVIYASSSRALAALELVAHRNAIMEGLIYKIIVIEIPEKKGLIDNIQLEALPNNWQSLDNYSKTQKIGGEWFDKKTSLLFKIPSAIIKEEYNYIINTNHPEFSLLKIVSIEDFVWDKRLL